MRKKECMTKKVHQERLLRNTMSEMLPKFLFSAKTSKNNNKKKKFLKTGKIVQQFIFFLQKIENLFTEERLNYMRTCGKDINCFGKIKLAERNQKPQNNIETLYGPHLDQGKILSSVVHGKDFTSKFSRNYLELFSLEVNLLFKTVQ